MLHFRFKMQLKEMHSSEFIICVVGQVAGVLYSVLSSSTCISHMVFIGAVSE